MSSVWRPANIRVMSRRGPAALRGVRTTASIRVRPYNYLSSMDKQIRCYFNLCKFTILFTGSTGEEWREKREDQLTGSFFVPLCLNTNKVVLWRFIFVVEIFTKLKSAFFYNFTIFFYNFWVGSVFFTRLWRRRRQRSIYNYTFLQFSAGRESFIYNEFHRDKVRMFLLQTNFVTRSFTYCVIAL